MNPQISPSQLNEVIKRLRPLHAKLAPPKDGDWLKAHPEQGQTFREYQKCDPVRPTTKRRTIYVQPIGTFTPEQQQILNLTVEFIGVYLCLPVVMQEPLPPTAIPAKARRSVLGSAAPQILSTYILDEVLLPSLPQDAASRIALTANDLWPGNGWNYVFGQASTGDRV
ncbi:MAG: hypothetical protein Q8O00_15010, partial [Holophaga sp.]|nr:hypothetical protein [Holophaga sp.]